MSDIVVYHPGTGGQASVPDSALPHLRMSGWLTLDEHQANEAQRAAAAAGEKKTGKAGSEEK